MIKMSNFNINQTYGRKETGANLIEKFSPRPITSNFFSQDTNLTF